MKGTVLFALLIGSSSRSPRRTPNLLPTPRLSNGKPDLTGVYQASNRRGREWDAQTPGAAPGSPRRLQTAA